MRHIWNAIFDDVIPAMNLKLNDTTSLAQRGNCIY